MIEQWRDIIGYGGVYQVSTLGRVWCLYSSTNKGSTTFPGTWSRTKLATPRLRKLSVNKRGYQTVCLSLPGVKARTYMVHALVLSTFVGPRPDGMGARHLNDIKTDNRLDNLCWGTQADNISDVTRNGLGHEGIKSPHAKLTDEKVVQMRRFYFSGKKSLQELGEEAGVSIATAQRAVTGTGWRHVKVGVTGLMSHVDQAISELATALKTTEVGGLDRKMLLDYVRSLIKDLQELDRA